MSRLIVISNRLPFTIDKCGDDISIRQSSGGLVSALKSFFDKSYGDEQEYRNKIWIGSVDADEKDWEAAGEKNSIRSDFDIVPLFLDKACYDAYYNGFANSVIWPLFHYFPSLADFKKEYFEAFVKINEVFAKKILQEYQEGDVIWIHDYQLMMVPHLIRQSLPDATIGFFLHIPFPSYEIFRLIPTDWKRSILQGMLGADLIGFHTHDYVQHFIQSAKMVLRIENSFNTIQYDNRLIKADLFPISIDYEKFRKAITDELVVTICDSLEKRFKGQKIIFSVDRLDYTKGLNYRLKGFEEFLERNPDWLEKVVFILNVIPSRDDIAAYVTRRKEIEERVSAINGKYSTLHWQPLIYRYNHLGFEEMCSLYQTADVALITPLRDGMNLVAKEYIASCLDKGVLILSELTGAASELNEAVQVNPTDATEVADAILLALTMPLVEQRSRLSYMQRRIAEYNVTKWINDFLDILKQTKEEQSLQQINILDAATIEVMMNEFHTAEKRCILLDYDGTLAPYQKLPSLALPSDELLESLTALTNDVKNDVVIISGRDADTLTKWLGHLPLNIVSEHGASIRYKGEEWQQQVSASPEWKEKIRPLLQLFVSRCVGSFIEEKKNTLAWHYRNTHPDLGFIRSRELRNSLLQLITNTPLQVIDGNKVLEVRLIGVDKGATAQKLLAKFNPNFILCMGDDTTDEDMFKTLREMAYTIKIGTGNTAARFTMLSQKQVLPLLKKFIPQVRNEHYGFA